MRKLVICMDGTGNEIGDSETNVLKFYRSFSQDAAQKTHYILGVGAYDRQSLLYRPLQKLQGVAGLAFGLGLEDDVLEAYRWLCRNFRTAAGNKRHWRDDNPRRKMPEDFADDHIYVVGFSRGSYAARVLAGFINNFGLVKPNDLHLIVGVFRAYRRITMRDTDEPTNVRYKALRQFGNVMRPRAVPIRALCLFDTVASMIRPDWPWFTLPRYRSLFDLGMHANTSSNPSVRIVIHAMAIDEKRAFFRVLRWLEGEPYFGNRFRDPEEKRQQYVRQRWFAGYHGDVGGSAREDETGIGKITALWMLDALETAEKEADAEDLSVLNANLAKGSKPAKSLPSPAPGLRFRKGNKEVYFLGQNFENYKTHNPGGYHYSGPNPMAPLHNSVFEDGPIPRWSWFWLPLEILIKSIQRREKCRPAWFRRGLLWYLPLLEPRHIPDDEEVDDSVFIRRDDPKCHYDPKNMTRPTPPGVGG